MAEEGSTADPVDDVGELVESRNLLKGEGGRSVRPEGIAAENGCGGDDEPGEAARFSDALTTSDQPDHSAVAARHNGGAAPSAGAPMSRNAIKRQRKLARIAERNILKRQLVKEKKKATREQRHTAFSEHLASLPDDQSRELATQALKDKARAEKQTKRDDKKRVYEAIKTASRLICIDCGWNADMTEKELKSLVKQLGHSYSAVGKKVTQGGIPLRLVINGFDSLLETQFAAVAPGWTQWPLEFEPRDLEKSPWRTDRPADLVYLTSDGDEVLEELKDNEIYIIGGIVDRNRLKFATKKKADRLGIRTARLKLANEVTLSNSTPVLTVNHVVELLAEVANSATWADAMVRVLPQRKGVERVE